MRGKKITSDVESIVIDLHVNKGMRNIEIAKELSLAEVTVSNILHKNNAYIPRNRYKDIIPQMVDAYRNGDTALAISKKYGVPETTVKRVIHKHFTKEEIEKYKTENKKKVKHKKGCEREGWKSAKIEITCGICGKKFERYKYMIEGKKSHYCSSACHSLAISQRQTGESNPYYKGGVSFKNYCEKFNAEFKRRIRAYMGNTCTLCGKTKEENKGKNMACHHIYDNKQACCDGSPRLFALLCRSCHGRETRTNANMEKLVEIVYERYGGKCYYTKEEWKDIVLKANCKQKDFGYN